MPAPLPPTSMYTYAVELSVDQAMSAGAVRVSFDRPVVTYVDNFLGIPAGKVVPVGTRIVPVQFSGDPKQNDFRPILVSESEAARIEKLVKETYSKGIGGS